MVTTSVVSVNSAGRSHTGRSLLRLMRPTTGRSAAPPLPVPLAASTRPTNWVPVSATAPPGAMVDGVVVIVGW
jgi:hypothetical protein